ncbi:CBL-interacting serine/threonine-protein kinase 24 (Protein SALT OVERLY SENSITIVE 2) (SNF1-related kinase 3.11), partial [Durusdinium trenchii]
KDAQDEPEQILCQAEQILQASLVTSVGNGQFGSVYQVNSKVAVKHVRGQLVDVMSEIRVLQLVQSENVVRLLGFAVLPSQAYIYVEMCSGGDMGGKTFDEDSLAPLMLQLVNAVQHVHGKGAIHQDIKPRNMFLKDTRLLLGDFGCVCLQDGVQCLLVSGFPAFHLSL